MSLTPEQRAILAWEHLGQNHWYFLDRLRLGGGPSFKVKDLLIDHDVEMLAQLEYAGLVARLPDNPGSFTLTIAGVIIARYREAEQKHAIIQRYLASFATPN